MKGQLPSGGNSQLLLYCSARGTRQLLVHRFYEITDIHRKYCAHTEHQCRQSERIRRVVVPNPEDRAERPIRQEAAQERQVYPSSFNRPLTWVLERQ